MPEVPFSGKDHGDGMLIRHAYRLFVTDRATWLDNRGHASFRGGFDAVGEGEVSIGGQDGAASAIPSFRDRQVNTGDAVHLSSSDPHHRQLARQHNRV